MLPITQQMLPGVCHVILVLYLHIAASLTGSEHYRAEEASSGGAENSEFQNRNLPPGDSSRVKE